MTTTQRTDRPTVRIADVTFVGPAAYDSDGIGWIQAWFDDGDRCITRYTRDIDEAFDAAAR